MTNTPYAWEQFIKEEQKKPYFKALLRHLKQQTKKGITIYPPTHERFNAFKLTPYSSVKVVIIGQDPYHGPGQAHGLCFQLKQAVHFHHRYVIFLKHWSLTYPFNLLKKVI